MTDDSSPPSLEKKPTASPAKPDPAPPAAPAPTAESQVRASDADRDRVAEILRDALAEGRLTAEEHSERIDAVYAAKTVGELEPVVRDLPVGRESPGYASHSYGAQRTGSSSGFSASYSNPHMGVGMGFGPKENLVAIFSGSERKGRWRVPSKINAFACFGGIEIDLTEAIFESQYLVINATAIFGGVEIRVPENVTLQQKGAGVFGGFDVKVSESQDPDAPIVLVKGAAIFGGVDAKPKRGKRIKNLRDRRRKEL